MAGSNDKQPEAPMVRAKARFVRVAPRKARLVADQVRGLAVNDARTLLAFSTRGAARDLARLIDSAAANAEANHELVADDLRIVEIRVDEGPTLKRWRARARGRVARIRKRTCHITVRLAQAAPVQGGPRKAEAPPTEAAASPEKPKRAPAKKRTPAKKKEAAA